MAKKDLAEKEEAGAIAKYDFGDDAGKGFEGTGLEDFSLPFVSVLQALSPQCNGSTKIEGAEPGMLFNTVTGELISGKDGLEFIPAYRKQVYVEWIPRDKGGGYVGEHELTSDIVKRAPENPRGPKGELRTAEGNDLIQTAYFYGIGKQPDKEPEPIVLAFTSTKLKVYRHFMTKVNQILVATPNGKQTPPLYAHRVKVATAMQKNKRGQEFFNFTIDPITGDFMSSMMNQGDDLYQVAKKLQQQVVAGSATINYDSAGKPDNDGDEIPF